MDIEREELLRRRDVGGKWDGIIALLQRHLLIKVILPSYLKWMIPSLHCLCLWDAIDFIIMPVFSECKVHEGRDFHQLCSLLYIQLLDECPTHNSTNIDGMNE